MLKDSQVVSGDDLINLGDIIFNTKETTAENHTKETSENHTLRTLDGKYNLNIGCPTLRTNDDSELYKLFYGNTPVPYIIMVLYLTLGAYLFRKEPATHFLVCFNIILFSVVATIVSKYISEPVLPKALQDLSIATSTSDTRIGDNIKKNKNEGILNINNVTYYREKREECNRLFYKTTYTMIGVIIIYTLIYSFYVKKALSKESGTLLWGSLFITLCFITEWYIMQLSVSKYIHFSGNYLLGKLKSLENKKQS